MNEFRLCHDRESLHHKAPHDDAGLTMESRNDGANSIKMSKHKIKCLQNLKHLLLLE